MQVHAGREAEEAETAEESAVVVLYDTHEQAEEAISNLQRSEFASNLTEFGKMVKIHEAEKQITTLMQPSLPVLDICDQHFLCRMAKKLGCQFCANDVHINTGRDSPKEMKS